MNQLKSLLSRRVTKVLPDKAALAKIVSERRIKLYQGFDATGGKLHLGHSVGLKKLMEFADAGHEVIFLFGTGTVLVGDPSERDTGRKLITPEEVEANIKNWQQQTEKIVDYEKIKILKNGDWLTQLTLKDLIRIGSNISAVQLFKRDSFKRRISRGDTVWFHETLYPLLQGYDSVVMDVDLEIGGTDQEFNMLVGRELQRKMNHREKFVLTTPMIRGTDGGNMSKTTGNCIWLDDQPSDMYGKLLSIPDSLIYEYWHHLTNLPETAESELMRHPFESKKKLAFEITKDFHGVSQALEAEASFTVTIQQGQVPKDLPEISLTTPKLTLLELCKLTRLGESSGHIKRTITQGGVYLNNLKLTDYNQTITVKSGDVLKFGKRHYYTLRLV